MIKKLPSPKVTPSRKWLELQSRAEAHALKTGIPFHLWLLQVKQKSSHTILSISDPTTDLHRAFREELLS
jgi:hypothetical protein